ncbi:hypothetical protein B0H11DRAFT_1945615 [Mycena galericulata]|nr:hypothetical protein B0H11DRAFT_1945615 [Mycena galericulata]
MGPRTEENNPQTIYAKFKRDALEMARKREKMAVPKIVLKQRNLEQALDRVNNDENTPEEEKIRAAGEITEKLTNLERERHLKARNTTSTRNRIEGETICTHWTQSNKKAKPRDMIYALRKPAAADVDPDTPAQYEKNSQKMAELVRDYHEKLQVDENPPNEELRADKMKTTELPEIDLFLDKNFPRKTFGCSAAARRSNSSDSIKNLVGNRLSRGTSWRL